MSSRFAAGNGVARRSGVRAFEARGVDALPTDLRVGYEELRDSLIAEKGGLSELSVLEAQYIQKLADVSVTLDLLLSELQRRGILTAKGKVRSVFIQWLAALDRWDRYAQRVGTERRPKQVTPFELVRQAVAEANER